MNKRQRKKNARAIEAAFMRAALGRNGFLRARKRRRRRGDWGPSPIEKIVYERCVADLTSSLEATMAEIRAAIAASFGVPPEALAARPTSGIALAWDGPR